MGGPCRSPQTLGASPIHLALKMDDVQTFSDVAIAAGATVKMSLADQFCGDRYGEVTDPFGLIWSIGPDHRSHVQIKDGPGHKRRLPRLPTNYFVSRARASRTIGFVKSSGSTSACPLTG